MKTPAASPQGLSLVELLTTLAIVGIVTAIAIPNIIGLSSSANRAKNQQNAQYIVSVASAVRAAGYTNTWGDEDSLIDDLTAGITYRNMTFSISPLSSEEITGAKEFFYLDNNVAYYHATGAY